MIKPHPKILMPTFPDSLIFTNILLDNRKIKLNMKVRIVPIIVGGFGTLPKMPELKLDEEEIE